MAINRSSLRDSLDKRSVDGKQKGTRASRAYDRHFAGYREEYVERPNGKGGKVVRVYSGDYYVQSLRLPLQIGLRLLYWALWGAAVALFLTGATQRLLANATPYVAAGQALSMICLFLVALPLISLSTLYNRLTIGEYERTIKRLRMWTPLCAASFGVLILLSGIGLLAADGGFSAMGWQALLRYAVSAALMLAIFFTQRIVPSTWQERQASS